MRCHCWTQQLTSLLKARNLVLMPGMNRMNWALKKKVAIRIGQNRSHMFVILQQRQEKIGLRYSHQTALTFWLTAAPDAMQKQLYRLLQSTHAWKS